MRGGRVGRAAEGDACAAEETGSGRAGGRVPRLLRRVRPRALRPPPLPERALRPARAVLQHSLVNRVVADLQEDGADGACGGRAGRLRWSARGGARRHGGSGEGAHSKSRRL